MMEQEQLRKHPLNIVMKRLEWCIDKMVGSPEVTQCIEHETDLIKEYCSMKKSADGEFRYSNRSCQEIQSQLTQLKADNAKLREGLERIVEHAVNGDLDGEGRVWAISVDKLNTLLEQTKEK